MAAPDGYMPYAHLLLQQRQSAEEKKGEKMKEKQEEDGGHIEKERREEEVNKEGDEFIWEEGAYCNTEFYDNNNGDIGIHENVVSIDDSNDNGRGNGEKDSHPDSEIEIDSVRAAGVVNVMVASKSLSSSLVSSQSSSSSSSS